jgi:hypothetical protein
MRATALGLYLLLTTAPWMTVARATELAPVEIPAAADLRHDAELAGQSGLPILLLVVAPGCHYCKLVEEQFIKPMIRGGAYADRVLIRRLPLDVPTLVGFDGRRVGARALARVFGVRLTPTVLFLGPRGDELAPRVVGISNEYYYGGLIDEGIAAAGAVLRPAPAGHLLNAP